MTVKTKHYIEVSDIVGLHFECSHCNSALDVELEKLKAQMLHDCPVCGGQWAVISNPTGAQIGHTEPFTNLVKNLLDLKRILEHN